MHAQKDQRNPLHSSVAILQLVLCADNSDETVVAFLY